jgi:transposase
MIPLPTGTKIWLVAGITDMRNGFNGLAAKVQTALKDDRCPATSSSSGAAAAVRLNFCGPPATGCVC